MRKHGIPESRPLLVFNHNPKAAGGAILQIAREMKKCEITIERKHHPKALKNQTRIDECFVNVKEEAETTYEDRKIGYVIGSVREPCGQYVSQWSYSSRGGGGFRRRHEELEGLYGKDAPFFNSTEDVQLFQTWQQHPSVWGSISTRFERIYGENLSGVDCLVFVENFNVSLVRCLQDYEAQGGFVDWNTKYMLDIAQTSEVSRGSHRFLSHKNPVKNTQWKHHSKCSFYYGETLPFEMENGPEKIIYEKFGYRGCCSLEFDPSMMGDIHRDTNVVLPCYKSLNRTYFLAVGVVLFLGVLLVVWKQKKRAPRQYEEVPLSENL